MPSFPPVTHVIFDLDGTILDSEVIYSEIFNKIMKRFGKQFTDEIKAAIRGRAERDVGRIIIEMTKIPLNPEEFRQETAKLVKTDLTKPPLKPGAERIIKHLATNNIPLAIATSSSEESYKIKTSQYKELFGLFHHMVSGSSDPEVVNGKPAPDIFLITASRFPDKPDSKKCLVFEDSKNGMLSAIAAGMQVVMIPETDKEENGKGAHLVLNSLEEFNPKDFGLPPYPSEMCP